MIIYKLAVDSFHGPLIIDLPPSSAAAQRLAKQHDLPVRGWSTHLGTTDAIWSNPEADSQVLYSVAVPSCNDVPRFPHIFKNDTHAQMVTYLLVILTAFSIEWPEVTKVFNQIWSQPDMRIVFGVEPDQDIPAARAYHEISEEILKKMWATQTMYGKDLRTMRLALESIECEKKVDMMFADDKSRTLTWSESPMRTIELRSDDAGVVLVKREVDTVQPQVWASILALLQRSPLLRDDIQSY